MALCLRIERDFDVVCRGKALGVLSLLSLSNVDS